MRKLARLSLLSQSTPSVHRKVFSRPRRLSRPQFPGMRSVTVRVPVPVKHAHKVPNAVRWKSPAPVNSPRNHNRVRLNPASLPVVWKRVRVDYPRALPVVAPHYTAIRDWQVVHHSRRSTERLLRRERNVVRNNEVKSHKRKARNGHLGSVKHDRYGMIAAGLRAGLSTQQLSDIAMVSNSIGV